jgi:hypothetical protein
MLIRFAAAFIRHDGRRPASRAAGAVRSQARHRAALVRFLAEAGWAQDGAVLTAVAELLLRPEARRQGTGAFILDQTLCGQQGAKTENTFRRGHYRRRPQKGHRKNKKLARRSCHGFVMGLLLTPSGRRLPCCRCYYYTKDYCQAQGKGYRTPTRLAAELIRAAAVPDGAHVVVRGDTAFDAQVLRAARKERGFHWVVPVNPERVLAGAKPRPKVSSLVRGLAAQQFAPVRLVSSQGPFAAPRRVARCRLGPKGKGRTDPVHPERRAVHAVGEVLLVFSAQEKPGPGKPAVVQKGLRTDDGSLSAARGVGLYDRRWQIELFVKELQGTLGFHQYRFREFAKVPGWVPACLGTFCDLEWSRARPRRRRGLSDAERRWWQGQRSHGLGQAPRQEAEGHDPDPLLEWAQTRTGLRKLKRCLRAARPLEYRKPRKNQREHAA